MPAKTKNVPASRYTLSPVAIVGVILADGVVRLRRRLAEQEQSGSGGTRPKSNKVKPKPQLPPDGTPR